ncbi:MAG: MFS transporter [Candidatus Lambdaproteobacteria bacterium]|nr:MFS transporter [Candidatus Lambdaproteobacteria bacterium]
MTPAGTEQANAAPHGREQRYGWVMVAVAGVFLGVGGGSLSSISVFLKPLIAEFGWLRGQTAFAYTAGWLTAGLGGIALGYLNDRFSTRAVVLVGATVMGGAYLLLASQQTLWQFYVFFCLLGGLGSGAFRAPLFANVGQWFQSNRGLALGFTTAGQAIGQGLVPFLAGWIIAGYGWRAAYLTLGLAAWALLVPLTFLIRPPPPAASPPGAGASAATGGRVSIAPWKAITWMSSAVFFCCFCMSTALVHVVALAQDRGIPLQTAASIVTLMYVVSIAGRVGYGRLADRIGSVRTYLLAGSGQAALVYWFTQVDSLAGFYLVAASFGLFFSGVMTSATICVRDMTPVRRRGLSHGIVNLFSGLGMGLGGFQAGLLFDLTGSYRLPFAIAAGAGLINALIVAALLLYLGRRTAVPGLSAQALD